MPFLECFLEVLLEVYFHTFLDREILKLECFLELYLNYIFIRFLIGLEYLEEKPKKYKIIDYCPLTKQFLTLSGMK